MEYSFSLVEVPKKGGCLGHLLAPFITDLLTGVQFVASWTRVVMGMGYGARVTKIFYLN